VRIGELAEASGMTTKTLRFYEEAGLLPAPERTSGGYRDYDPEVVPRLDFIRRSRAAGLTLAQIRDVLDVRDGGTAPCTTSATCSTRA
jgi:DNA-binding transcriptional MerR regulator